MPELPDVEGFRRVLAEGGLHKRIEKADLTDPPRLKKAKPKALRDALEGRAFSAARRHGKICFAVVDEGPALVMHFGMTGALKAYGEGEDDPGDARLLVRFSDGSTLAFRNQRKLGWLELADDPDAYLRAEGIGPDALAIEEDAFAERIGASTGMVKAMLMDQKKIAGIGNVYSDEILFQSKVAPHTKAKDLEPRTVRRIHKTMNRVLEKTIELGADRSRMPRTWLAPRRDDGGLCPRCDGRIETRTVGGRTAYYCPSCQAG